MVEALLGIIVGGLLSGAVQAYFRWEDRRDIRRTGVRSLLREMWWLEVSITTAIEKNDLRQLEPDNDIPARWAADQAAFTRLSTVDWHTIDVAVRSATLVNDIAAGVSALPEGEPVPVDHFSRYPTSTSASTPQLRSCVAMSTLLGSAEGEAGRKAGP